MARHLILGASHALFMAQGLGRFQADWHSASQGTIPIDVDVDVDGNGKGNVNGNGDGDGDADRWELLFLTPKTQFLTFHHGSNGVQAVANPALLSQVAAFNTPLSKVVCLIGGNEHNSRFMMAHPQPFDFVHPRGPAPKAGRQLVPRRFVQRALHDSLGVTLLTLRTLAGLLPSAQRFLVAPPPPIESEHQIRSHPEIFDFAQRAVEDAGVRLKTYETMIDELTGAAAALGYAFLAAPSEQRDARGFLAESYWHYSTHATPAYYAPLWRQLGAGHHAPV